jgi:hypothetical protein
MVAGVCPSSFLVALCATWETMPRAMLGEKLPFVAPSCDAVKPRSASGF